MRFLSLSILLFITVLSGCSSLSLKLSTPFRVVSNNELQEMYLVVVTFTQYKTDSINEDKFHELTNNIVDNIESAEGLYGYSIRKDFLGNTAWTYTIWENSDAMNRFKVSEFHIEAMKSASTVLEEAKFARTFISPDELNYSWDAALELLEQDERSYSFGKYNQSSESYQ